jgi:hypothetical protein
VGGWTTVNYVALPGLAIVLLAVLWYQRKVDRVLDQN